MLKNKAVVWTFIAAALMAVAKVSAQDAPPAGGRGRGGPGATGATGRGGGVGNTGVRTADAADILAASASLAQILDRGARPALIRSASEELATLNAQDPNGDASDRIITEDAFHISYVTRRKPNGPIAHASGMDKGAEVHIIVDGSGTVITGGKVVRSQGTAGQDVTVVGGVSRKVGKGDVIYIPAGSPHFYSQIDGSITYYEIRFDLHRGDKSFVELQK
jgi:mannose-6-phosphate isomerase-like protein (cupin superfamily)